MPKLVARLVTDFPQAAVRLLDGDQRRIPKSLHAGESDLALLYDFDLGKDVVSEPLAELQPYVLLPECHHLATKATIGLAELADQSLVLLDLQPSRDYFLSLFRSEGLIPCLGLQAKSFEMVCGFVGHGLGYGLLAARPGHAMTHDGRVLVTRPLARPVRSSRLVLALSPHRRLTAISEAFRAIAISFFSRPSPP
jgi:DNA-binding transcriptional LysR family regulator